MGCTFLRGRRAVLLVFGRSTFDLLNELEDEILFSGSQVFLLHFVVDSQEPDCICGEQVVDDAIAAALPPAADLPFAPNVLRLYLRLPGETQR